jgi:hypothetical protein
MTISFENDTDIIVYALEKIIAYARRTQQIFIAQCIWWLALVIGLEPGLVNHIDNLHGRTVSGGPLQPRDNPPATQSPLPEEPKEERLDIVLKECEEYLKESRRLRDIAALKSKGTTWSGRINPTPISKKILRKDRSSRNKGKGTQQHKEGKENYTKINGISDNEIKRRKEIDECLHCAWPSDRKGNHQVKDCIRPIKIAKGTVAFPKERNHQQAEQRYQQPTVEEASSEGNSSEESSDDSL